MVAYDEPCVVPIKRTLQKIDYQNQTCKELEEPCTKRVRPLGRVTSLANLISPVKNGAVRRFGQTLQALDTASLEQAVSSDTNLVTFDVNAAFVPCLQISIIQAVLADINMKKGESECQYYIDKLEYLDDRQKDPRIEQCKSLLCHGELRNKSGTKLHVFLFTEVLVLTRPVTRNDRHCFQVYRQPIPVQDLILEDLQDGDVRMGGSFRGAFSNADKAKNIFRVRFQDPSQGQSHTLQVNDVFHKQQWINCLRTAMSTQKDSTDINTKRRSSSVSAIIHMEETDENCPRAAASAPSSPSPTPSATSTLSSSSSSSSISAPFLPRKSKKDKRSICSLGKRKETMV
uniref:Neuroepithelial cell transforming 1 n=1 Tax=Sinocyclocheilus rhinocerous TaxID=307959 RepID=A0A673MF05_9TELE